VTLRRAGCVSRRLALVLALGLICAVGVAHMRAASAAGPTVPVSGPTWASLTPAQQLALSPLKPSWDSNDVARKRKWIEVADRFPRMPAEERQRVQERMASWAAMSPNERAQARVQFQETRRIGAEERQARWQAYQALPEAERKRLAHSAATPAKAEPRVGAAAARTESSGAKRNLVATTPSPQPRSVAATVVQAKPGASTTTVAATAKPPLHHQPGLPKIVATPTFVDPQTLLPRRGPQAAAMRTAASSDPTQQP
jgi:hypothetical protein